MLAKGKVKAPVQSGQPDCTWRARLRPQRSKNIFFFFPKTLDTITPICYSMVMARRTLPRGNTPRGEKEVNYV